MLLLTKYQGSRPCCFRQEDVFMFLPIKAYVKPVTPGRSHFLPKGYNWNKSGRSLLDGASYQISKL